MKGFGFLAFAVTVTCVSAFLESGVGYSSVHNRDYEIVSTSEKSRLFGGTISVAHSRPFQATLYAQGNGTTGFCSAVLISANYLLTAAHCTFIHGEPADSMRVQLGAHNIYENVESGRLTYTVADVIVHPDWNTTTLQHDIALLRLPSMVLPTFTIEYANLPPRNLYYNNFAGNWAKASGWGIVRDNVDFISPQLREAAMLVVTRYRCNAFYFGDVEEEHICAEATNVGMCLGDAGGPLTIVWNSETILIGISSFVRSGSCESSWPSVFSRVTSYIDWIRDVANIPED